ncbi:MAG: peptidoglycan DD-metalloendopeptidase family protein [Magnetococcales bacterium]|nr:peptidoglycan DD-metalloendopeptidase family protein [Magnetococcales bacterium]
MRNHLTVTIRTVNGQQQYRIGLFWIGALLIALCFTLGTFYNVPPDHPQSQPIRGTTSPPDETVPPISFPDPGANGDPFRKPAPTHRVIPELAPEVASLDGLFDTKNHFGNPPREKEPEYKNDRQKPRKETLGNKKKHPPPPLHAATAPSRSAPILPFPGFERIILESIPNGSPIEFKGINSPFGDRSHSKRKQKFHPGIDLFAPMNTPTHTTADGVVEFAGFEKMNSYGNLVIIHHNHGFKTSYAHLDKITVKNGDFVKKGDLIGYSGTSGLSSGPHLHYEIHFVHRILDPTGFLDWNANNLAPLFREKQVAWQSLIDHINRRPETSELPLPLRIALTQGGYKPP